MLKRYLVAHDDSITDWAPAFVSATSAEEAITRYLQQIYSKDMFFREYVQSLRSFDSFVGNLVYSTSEEKISFMDGNRIPAPELVKKRILDFFIDKPNLGQIFLKYVESENTALINDAIYEFIAVRDPEGIVAIEETSIRNLEQEVSI